MRNLRRSLRYLWPYRARIFLSVLCVGVISLLWAGGLGAILPGAKILLSPEGLHGWAYAEMLTDRLGTTTERRPGPERFGLEAEPMLFVSADASGGFALPAGSWIVGLEDGDPSGRVMPAAALARRLALMGGRAALRVYLPHGDELRVVAGALGRLRFSSRLLAWFARTFPEPARYADRFGLLVVLLGFVLVVTVLRAVLRLARGYLLGSALHGAANDLRCASYSAALAMPVGFFSLRGFTDVMSRMVRDNGQVGRGQALLLGKLVAQPAQAAAAMAVALMLSWKLTLLALVAGPLVFFAIRRLGKAMRRMSRRALQSFSKMLAIIEETLNGIRVVKAYTMESAERKRFRRVGRELLGQEIKMLLIDAGTGVVLEVLSVIAAVSAVAVAGYWTFHGLHGMDQYKLLALIGCLAAMFGSLRKLTKVVPSLQAAEAAAGRVFELHDLPREKSPSAARMLGRCRQGVEFAGVSFRYDGADRDALAGIDLYVPAEQTVAIVGPNGSGKTTLVSLLPRLLAPTAGRVLIDGVDTAECSLRSLRRQIALVDQETVLFHATIAENISYGLSRPSERQVLQAARKAYVDEFVRELPDGYETVIGPRGATLSGGQRQRVAIARAILRDPAILIFDEALSQVDPDSQKRIGQAMADLRRSTTTFVIAHSAAALAWADRIVVMDAGRIVASGAHQELTETCELYRKLYHAQLAGVRQ